MMQIALSSAANIEVIDNEILVVEGCALGFVAPQQPPHVLHVDPGTLMEKHGVQSDDLLVGIDGGDPRGMTQDEIANALRDASKLEFRRPEAQQDGEETEPPSDDEAAQARGPAAAEAIESAATETPPASAEGAGPAAPTEPDGGDAGAAVASPPPVLQDGAGEQEATKRRRSRSRRRRRASGGEPRHGQVPEPAPVDTPQAAVPLGESGGVPAGPPPAGPPPAGAPPGSAPGPPPHWGPPPPHHEPPPGRPPHWGPPPWGAPLPGYPGMPPRPGWEVMWRARPPEPWRAPPHYMGPGRPPGHPGAYGGHPHQDGKGKRRAPPRLEVNETGGATLVVERVPPVVNNMDVLNEFFAHFGSICELQINHKRNEAIITFARAEDAEQALRRPVLNDPAIGLRPWRSTRAARDIPIEEAPYDLSSSVPITQPAAQPAPVAQPALAPATTPGQPSVAAAPATAPSAAATDSPPGASATAPVPDASAAPPSAAPPAAGAAPGPSAADGDRPGARPRNMELKSGTVLQKKRQRDEIEDRRRKLLQSLTDQLKIVMARISDPQADEKKREQYQTLLANIKEKITVLTPKEPPPPPMPEPPPKQQRVLPPTRSWYGAAQGMHIADAEGRSTTLRIAGLPAEFCGAEERLKNALGEGVQSVRGWSEDGSSCIVQFADHRFAEATLSAQKVWGFAAEWYDEGYPPQSSYPTDEAEALKEPGTLTSYAMEQEAEIAAERARMREAFSQNMETMSNATEELESDLPEDEYLLMDEDRQFLEEQAALAAAAAPLSIADPATTESSAVQEVSVTSAAAPADVAPEAQPTLPAVDAVTDESAKSNAVLEAGAAPEAIAASAAEAEPRLEDVDGATAEPTAPPEAAIAEKAVPEAAAEALPSPAAVAASNIEPSATPEAPVGATPAVVAETAEPAPEALVGEIPATADAAPAVVGEVATIAEAAPAPVSDTVATEGEESTAAVADATDDAIAEDAEMEAAGDDAVDAATEAALEAPPDTNMSAESETAASAEAVTDADTPADGASSAAPLETASVSASTATDAQDTPAAAAASSSAGSSTEGTTPAAAKGRGAKAASAGAPPPKATPPKGRGAGRGGKEQVAKGKSAAGKASGGAAPKARGGGRGRGR